MDAIICENRDHYSEDIESRSINLAILPSNNKILLTASHSEELQLMLASPDFLLTDLPKEQQIDSSFLWHSYSCKVINQNKVVALNFYQTIILLKLSAKNISNSQQLILAKQIFFFNRICSALLHGLLETISRKSSLSYDQFTQIASSFASDLALNDKELKQLVSASLWINLHDKEEFATYLNQAKFDNNRILDAAAGPNDSEYFNYGILSRQQMKLNFQVGGHDLITNKILAIINRSPNSFKQLIHLFTQHSNLTQAPFWHALPSIGTIIQEFRDISSQQFIPKAKILMSYLAISNQGEGFSRGVNSYLKFLFSDPELFEQWPNDAHNLNHLDLTKLAKNIAMLISLDELNYFSRNGYTEGYKRWYTKVTQLIENYLQKNKIAQKNIARPSEDGVFALIQEAGLLPYFLAKGFFYAKAQQIIAKKINSLASNNLMENRVIQAGVTKQSKFKINADWLVLYPRQGKPSSQLYFLQSGSKGTNIDIFSQDFIKQSLSNSGIVNPRTNIFYLSSAFISLS